MTIPEKTWGQYEKAIEYYEKALLAFNIPNHPKYLAALEGIRKAKKELATKSGSVQPKVYAQDAIIQPGIFYIRLYSNIQLPQEGWHVFVLRALDASLEIHPQLKEMVGISGTNANVQSSWEYVPYFDEAFKNAGPGPSGVAADRGQTFFESLLASPNPKLCRLFSSDIAFSVHEQSAQGLIFVVVFGDELVDNGSGHA